MSLTALFVKFSGFPMGPPPPQGPEWHRAASPVQGPGQVKATCAVPPQAWGRSGGVLGHTCSELTKSVSVCTSAVVISHTCPQLRFDISY